MLRLAVACLILALIAAAMGFGGIAGSFVGAAQALFVVFLILSVAFAIVAGIYRRRTSVTR